MRKKKTKKEKEIKLQEEVKNTDVGDVLELTADKKNPASDGLEYKDGSENE